MNTANFTKEIKVKKISASDYVDKFIDVDKFLGFCKECRSYERNWACPPFNFNPLDIFSEYENLYIIAYKIYIPEEKLNIKNDDYVEKIYTYWKDDLSLSLLNLLKVKGIKGRVLSAGRCNFCESCMRNLNLPCVNEEMCQYSIESLGGDVIRTVKEILNEDIIWIKDRKLPSYIITCGGILTDIIDFEKQIKETLLENKN